MINHVAEQLTGWGEQSAIGHLYHEVFPGEYERVVEKVIYTEQTVEIEQQSLVPCNGDSVIVASTVSPIQGLDGLVRGAVVVFRDISESVRQRKKIEFLSYYDHLTGLLNRRGFTRELERCDQSSSLPLAVIVGDVNGLKSINDAFGHAFGDELLVKTAKILQAGITAPGFVARLGGDEFAVILPETNETQAKKIIARFNTLAEKQTVQSAPVSIAFGVAVKEDMSQELQAIFNLAEKRMYLDKRLKNSSHRFLPHLEKEEPDRTDEIGAEENIMD